MAAGKLTIYEPFPVSASASSQGAENTSLLNAFTNDPKEVYLQNSGTGRNLYIDLGSVQTVDTFHMGFSNAVLSQGRLYSCDNLAGANAVARSSAKVMRPADCKTIRASMTHQLTVPFASRYWYIQLNNLDGFALQIGRIDLCHSFSADFDREWGSGRRPIDTGRSTALLGGGFGTQEGVRKAGYSWTFGDLTEAELETLWGIFLRRGTTQPVIVNEWEGAAVAANEKLHYGLFQRLDQFERREPNATKWGMELEEWV